MNTLDILRAARDLISNKDRWTQGSYARDRLGIDCSAQSESACSFCAVGAVCRVWPRTERYFIDVDAKEEPALTALAAALGKSPRAQFDVTKEVTFFNDIFSHADVLAMFDRAIASEEARAGEAG